MYYKISVLNFILDAFHVQCNIIVHLVALLSRVVMLVFLFYFKGVNLKVILNEQNLNFKMECYRIPFSSVLISATKAAKAYLT